MSFSLISEEERGWNRLTTSKLNYSIEWNNSSGFSSSGQVRVVAPDGRVLMSKERKARNANAAMGLGEDLLSQHGYGKKIIRREFNAAIPIINLEKL